MLNGSKWDWADYMLFFALVIMPGIALLMAFFFPDFWFKPIV